MVMEEPLKKKPIGRCERCKQLYGVIVSEESEILGHYNDCVCFDDQIETELKQEYVPSPQDWIGLRC